MYFTIDLLYVVCLSDNVSCPTPNLMYKCSDNRCIYMRWMCDGEKDCKSGEDEEKDMCKRKYSKTSHQGLLYSTVQLNLASRTPLQHSSYMGGVNVITVKPHIRDSSTA